MNPRQRHEGNRIASGATVRRPPLRLAWLSYGLSALLVLAGGIVAPARTEGPLSAPIVSSCRPTAELAAFGGPLPKAQAGMKGAEFIRIAMIQLSQGITSVRWDSSTTP